MTNDQSAGSFSLLNLIPPRCLVLVVAMAYKGRWESEIRFPDN
jgi:hypothetical protein